MKRYSCLLIALFLTVYSFSQINDVSTCLNNAASNAKKSWESGKNAMNEIQKCHLSTSLNDLQLNAKKALSMVENSANLAKEAELNTDEAEGEAMNIDSKAVKKSISNTKIQFKKAKNKFDDASSNLLSALDEDNTSSMINYLNLAIDGTGKAMDCLRKGVEELEKSSKELVKCK